MTKKFSLDRVEEGVAVCYDDDGNKYEFTADRLKLAPGSLFTAALDADGEPTDIVSLEDETRAARADAKRRLDALFARKPNKKA